MLVAEVDLGAEDWEFPPTEEASVPDAIRLWDALDRETREANKRHQRLKARKAAAKEFAFQVLEASGQTSGRAEVAPGREIQITPYEREFFTIKDEAAFKGWADGEAENYYDSSPRLRDSIFLDNMRRLSQDGEPLPPGVIRYTANEVSKTAVPSRRRRRGGPGTEQ